MRGRRVVQVVVVLAVMTAMVGVTQSASAIDPDITPPTVSIVTPADGATYSQGQAVAADYSCADEAGGSGLATCDGPVAPGDPIDTSTPGAHDFSVTATDVAGNSNTASVSYSVDAPPPVDETAPTIAIVTPADGAIYAQGATVPADYSCADEIGGSGLATCDGPVAAGAPIDTSTLGSHSFAVTATDNAGNSATSSVSYLVADRTAPTVAFTAPTDTARYPKTLPVTVGYTCTDEPGGSGMSPGHCVGRSIFNGVSTLAPVGSLLDTATTGAHAFSVTATDDAGNVRTVTIHYTVFLDVTPPAITLLVPLSNHTYPQDSVVNADYSCSDTGLGVKSCIGTVPSGSAIDTSTLGSHTFRVDAKDNGSNTATKVIVYKVVDKTPPPPPTVTTPVAGASYTRGSTVLADYACVDNPNGSGIKTCTGTVPVGAAITTATTGSKTFKVTATDNMGNHTQVIVNYSVVKP